MICNNIPSPLLEIINRAYKADPVATSLELDKLGSTLYCEGHWLQLHGVAAMLPLDPEDREPYVVSK